jgi:general secretion pathway protein I
MNRRGFTLLEVMVATLIMGIAVVGVLSGISNSLHNAARLADYDRAALLARSKMDELLVNYRLPKFTVVQGDFDPLTMGGKEGGWRAKVTPFEMPPGAGPGAEVLERVALEIWWKAGSTERKLTLEGFRSAVLRPEDVPR